MAAAKPNIRQYRVQAGQNAGMIIQINRQMRGVRILKHPDPAQVDKVYDLPDFLRDYDLEHMELV